MKIDASFSEWRESIENNPAKLKELAMGYLMQDHSRAVYIITDPIYAFLEHIIDQEWDSLWGWLSEIDRDNWEEYLRCVFESRSHYYYV